jgi:hypothetical protein
MYNRKGVKKIQALIIKVEILNKGLINKRGIWLILSKPTNFEHSYKKGIL